MAYETGTANSPGDLLVKLFDFAGANGWTIDEDITSDAQIPPQGAIHKNNTYVSFYFFTDVIKIYPARGYIGSNDPGEHTESLYNDTLTAKTSGKRVTEITGPYSAYHFFENDSNPSYIHIVIQLSNGSYRHFGFGEMVQFGDWQHGEYFYGHKWDQNASRIDVPGSTFHSKPFGTQSVQSAGANAGLEFYAKKNDNTAMPGADAADSFWFDCLNTLSNAGADADGREKTTGFVITGCDGGWGADILASTPSTLNGFTALLPIHVSYLDRAPTPDNWYIIGSIPDVRGVNINGLQTAVEYVIGADTWLLFPVTRGGTVVNDEEWSGNFGLAYKKVTT